MTSTVLGGTVDNGRRGNAVFSFYSGPVGIRHRSEGRMEIAFFAQGVKPQLPVEGLVDGQTVTAIEITQSGLTEALIRKPRVAPMQSVVVTVLPVTPA